MFDTTDLTSYYPGYDDYCESHDDLDEKTNYEWIFADNYYEEMMLRKGEEKMKRKIIDLDNTNMTFEEVTKLKNYVWKSDKLIPIEQLGNE